MLPGALCWLTDVLQVKCKQSRLLSRAGRSLAPPGHAVTTVAAAFEWSCGLCSSALLPPFCNQMACFCSTAARKLSMRELFSGALSRHLYLGPCQCALDVRPFESYAQRATLADTAHHEDWSCIRGCCASDAQRGRRDSSVRSASSSVWLFVCSPGRQQRHPSRRLSGLRPTLGKRVRRQCWCTTVAHQDHRCVWGTCS